MWPAAGRPQAVRAAARPDAPAPARRPNSQITQWGSIATDPSRVETWANEDWVDGQFQKMKSRFVDQGVGVILGEYGTISRQSVADHHTYRLYWTQYVSRSAAQHGLVPVIWDNGYAGDGGMALFDRNSGARLYPDLIQAVVDAVD